MGGGGEGSILTINFCQVIIPILILLSFFFFFFFFFFTLYSDYYLRSCGIVTCSRPQRMAPQLRSDPGTSGTGI